MKASQYWVYIIENPQGVLYTGYSTDPERRLKQHNSGTGAKFTRGRGPWVLVYQQPELTRGLALREEHRIKSFPKAKKTELIWFAFEARLRV